MRKIFTLLILLLLLPISAQAAAPSGQTIYVGNENVTSGGYWTTDNDGKVTASKAGDTPTDHYIHYDTANNTLTLHNATIKEYVSSNTSTYVMGAAIGVFNQNDASKLTIKLEGSNAIENVSTGIFVLAQSSSTGDATLTITGSGSLDASGSLNGIMVQSNSGDATLTIQSADVTLTSNSGNGVTVQAGSAGAQGHTATLTVNGGKLTASGAAGIQFNASNSSYDITTELTVSGNALVDTRNGGIEVYGTGAVNTTADDDATNGGIVFDGKDGTVYGDVTLDESLTINQGETLTVPDGSSLNCNKKLTNNGTVTIENGGTLTDADKVTNNGTINVEDGGKLEGTPTGEGTVVSAPKITTESLPDGTVGTAYNQTLQADNAPTQWSVTSGSLPNGLSLNSDGTITGTPTAEGTSTFTVKAENSVGSDSKELMLTVTAPTTYTITAEASPAEGGTVTVNGGTSSVSVEANSTVNLVATPNAGYRFTGWTSSNGGTFADASSVSTTFTMPANDVIVTAGFEQYYPVTSITLDKSELSLYTGNSETLTATIEPDNATNKNVTWSSDNADVAIVNNGTVKAMGAGDATITVTTEDVGKTATCVVHVRKPATVEPSGSTNLSFTTDRDEFSLTATVHAQGNDLNPKDGSWTWTVADADVVALSGSPTWRSQSYSISRQAFTIEGTGTTTITAIYDDGTYRGSVDFTVQISKPSPPDPISYYNIYVEDVCDGVEVSTSKNVVREGGSINVYVKKDTANYTFDNFHVYYKEGYYDSWDELKEGTQPGEYPIKNIWTHIYIKAEGAEEKEDPTGIESIEGVKVYTKDGSLYVQTPQREQVIIVSMSGAVVKNEEQVGLKQYHGLQPGIYIVRVGDRAYKVRLN